MNSSTSHKIRTLFVCRGNTCRSPLCESIFNEILALNSHLQNDFEFAKSAGVSTYTNQVSQGALKIGSIHGLGARMLDHVCTQFRLETFSNYDKILCMDWQNHDGLRAFAHKTQDLEESMKKVLYLRDFEFPETIDYEIDDPICAQLKVYENTYQQCLNCIVRYLMKFKTGSEEIDTSKLNIESFSPDKKNVVFVCRDNEIISPYCESLFNQTLNSSTVAASKFNISSSGKLYDNSNWNTRSCRPDLVEFGKTNGLDLSTHQSNYIFDDILESDFIIVANEHLKRKFIAMDQSDRKNKKYQIIKLTELTNNQEIKPNMDYETIHTLCSLAIQTLFTQILE